MKKIIMAILALSLFMIPSEGHTRSFNNKILKAQKTSTLSANQKKSLFETAVKKFIRNVKEDVRILRVLKRTTDLENEDPCAEEDNDKISSEGLSTADCVKLCGQDIRDMVEAEAETSDADEFRFYNCMAACEE